MANRKPRTLSLLEAASRYAGVWAGVTTAAGKSIAQASVSGTVALGGLLRRPLRKAAPASDGRPKHASNATASRQRSAEMATPDNAVQTRAAAPEFDPSPVLREPAAAPDSTGAAQLQLASQLAALRAERECLKCELGRARSEVEEVAGRASALTSQVAALQTDLAAGRRQTEEARRAAAEAEAELRRQLSAVQADRETLRFDLKAAWSELEETTAREGVLQARVAALESELDAARRELEEARSTAETLRGELQDATSQLSSVIRTIPAEEEVAPPNHDAGTVATVPVADDVDSLSGPAAAQPDTGTDSVGSGQVLRPATAADAATNPSPVSTAEAHEAVFPDAATKVFFRRALSDMASESVTVRVSAVRILGGIRHELSLRVLLAQLACEPSSQVRRECIQALTALEAKAGLPAIERALTDGAVAVRLAAVRGLYRLAGAKSVPALTRMLSDDDDEVRRRAATCLGWLGREESAVILLPLLADPSVAVRHAAIEALANLRSPSVVAALIERLNDSERSIQKAALSAIEILTGKRMGESSLGDEESRARLIARWRTWCTDNEPRTDRTLTASSSV